MPKTISTHNGSAAHRGHNRRDKWAVEKQEHIDAALTKNNLVLRDEAPREAYKRIFGEALERYNKQQERPERQIRDYYNHVQKDAKRHAVYEMIVQIGDRNDTGLDAPVERKCLVEFYRGWQQRNPNLECIGAYLHADETDGTVHMHIDYIPVAHGYKRGMDTQNGLVKALSEMGFKKQGKDTAQIQWERRENQALEDICLAHGIEVIHPGRQDKHLDTQVYKAQQRLQELQEDVDIAEMSACGWQATAAEYEQQADKAHLRLVEAQESLSSVQGDINTLTEQKTALASNIAVLENELSTQWSEVEQLKKQKTALENELSTQRGEVSKLKTQKDALWNEIKVRLVQRDILDSGQVRALEGRKTITGKLKDVTYDEYVRLKNTAAEVDGMRHARAKALDEMHTTKLLLDKSNKQLEQSRDSLESALQENEQLRENINAANKAAEYFKSLAKTFLGAIKQRVPELHDVYMEALKQHGTARFFEEPEPPKPTRTKSRGISR